MSAKREFNLFTVLGAETDCDADDVLTFDRRELSRDDPDGHDSGLSISYTIDSKMKSIDKNGGYEIHYIPCKMARERGSKAEKRDTIRIAHCLINTCEIRDLADWLIEQADEIDKEQ